MGKFEKLLDKILRGLADNNIDFAELCKLLVRFGFDERIRGSHHIFSKEGVEEIINLQSASARKAKGYQVKQVRSIILKYRLLSPKENE
ncbi:type II toxin-antitoxin system HicA family toxin [Runella aurantiaca]|uniref:Type II toxin-antitoxin system HicA family toxin n=1 Tax=Runella aurantiaca TaxID=2282308 RepID=A0A369IA72_9BACT|nr:type II toxin-antitoxin system HicA family toxin [Runella aurantiaca]RDB04433.1 type II toxin-antitoxin system HicA family toxin [Runella aurantiaca]